MRGKKGEALFWLFFGLPCRSPEVKRHNNKNPLFCVAEIWARARGKRVSEGYICLSPCFLVFGSSSGLGFAGFMNVLRLLRTVGFYLLGCKWILFLNKRSISPAASGHPAGLSRCGVPLAPLFYGFFSPGVWLLTFDLPRDS